MKFINGRRVTASNPKARSVRLEDIGAQLEVRRHPSARRLTLRVSRTRRAVIVTLPLQCDLDEAGSFLNRHIDWVRARLDSLPNHVLLPAYSSRQRCWLLRLLKMMKAPTVESKFFFSASRVWTSFVL